MPACVRRMTVFALLAFVAMGNFAHSHEKWLIPAPEVKRLAGEERPAAFRGLWPGVALAASALMVGLALAADRELRLRGIGAGLCRKLLEFRKAALPLVGITAGVVLVSSGATGAFLAPDLRLSDVSPPAFATALAGAQIAIGSCFIAGLFTRPAALALLILWAPGSALFGFRAWIDYVDVAGFGVFLAICGRGPLSIDALLGSASPSPRAERTAVAALRLSLGANLAILAVNDKLSNPLVSMKLVAAYGLNFTRGFGPLAFPDDRFVLAAFAVELAIGVAVAAGALARPAAVLVFIAMTATYYVFGFRELLGHLPILAGGVALLLMGTGGKWRMAGGAAAAELAELPRPVASTA
jgi:uncharacterized membrane protein YphA (DoxX/SURF4 family)